MISKQITSLAVTAAVAVALSACGGGGGPSSSAGNVTGDLMLPAGDAPTSGTVTIPAGQSVTQNGVVYACPSGGSDCQVTATAGSDSATYTGAMPTVTRATWATDPLATARGLASSSAAPVFAASEADTVGSAIASAANGLPVLSTSLHRQWDPTTDVRLTDSGTFHVQSIRSDGSGVFTVRYVLDGTEAEVSFDEATDCANGCEVTVGDEIHYLWQWWSAAPLSSHDGARYMDVFGYEWYAYDSQTSTDRDANSWYFVFGTRTEALPAVGEAIYRGPMRANLFDPDNPSGRNSWFMRGHVRLAANFDMSELQGRIYALRVEVPRDAPEVSWPTSSFELSDFAVNNGQFTATLTGVDSDPTTNFDASVRGFMGSVLGEFYGPNAEEVGGVVTAERDEDGDTTADRVLVGAFGAHSIDSGGDSSDAFFTGADIDNVAGTTALVDDVSNARLAVMADGAIQLTVNMTDGTSTTVELGDADHASHPDYDGRGQFVKKIGTTEYWLWSHSGATGYWSPPGAAGFDHFDVYGWEVYEFVEGANWPTTDYSAANNPTFSYGYLVDGSRTPMASMPASGSASYSGVFDAFSVPTDDTLYPNLERIGGSAMLAADFGAGSVSGTFDGVSRVSDGSAVDGALTFNAMVSGNTLSASDLTGSGTFSGYSNGSVAGAFYGPGAAEVGGVFEATDTGDANLISGWFGGERQ